MQLAAPDDQRCAAPGAGCCPACGSGRSERAFDVAGYELRRCRRCASLWATGAPGPDDLAGLYADASYYRNAEYSTGDFRGYRDYLADRASIEAKFEAVLARIERHVPPGTLLDVGSGPGLLVAAAQRRGWEARGLDLNPWAVAEAGSVAGAEVELGTLDDADLEAGSLDALTAMDLIEHLPGPGEWLDAAARAVRPGGGLALLTPDAGSPTTQVLGSRWPEVRRVPEHLVLYSVRGLAALLKRHGFESLCWHSVG
ncbi:MAG TPA: class I SAM-dependent methyltransferase, partial [Solirubrobacterales bacterium]|nr:class I SAM-dependent methyltransferase [Solirubrobacterales bacterium]